MNGIDRDKPQDKVSRHETAEWMSGTFLQTVQLPEESMANATLGGRYLIKQELGRGGFGAVYLALDQKMVSRPVVIKVLLDSTFADGWSIRRFRQEAEALARLDHPSIVGIFDVGETPEGRPYLVMQYVEGVSLRSAIKPEGMDFGRSANIIRQIGRALGAAHRKGIFHRDLKPENIMLRPVSDGDEQVKVIDFGVAKVRDSSTCLSSGLDRAVGTIAYMSPEQLSALPLTTASDVYAFGVVAFEMLTGRRPINPESIYQVLEMQRSGVRVKPIDLRPNLPEAAQEIMLKALSFEAQDRYQSVKDFGDQLAWALINDESTKPQTQIFVRHDAEAPAALGQQGYEPSQIPTARVSPRREENLPTRTEARPQHSGFLGNREKPENLPNPSFFAKHFSVIRVSGVALALMVAVGLLALNRKSQPPLTNERPKTSVQPALSTTASGQEQSLSYWLTVQKMAGRRPVGEPIQSSGDLMFGTGWKFRFNLRPAQSGALYLLNVGPAKNGKEEYNVLFPTHRDDRGDAKLTAEQTMQGGWSDFVEQTGVEKLWIIWSTQPLADLDAIFSDAAKHSGVIANSDKIAEVQYYLMKYYSERPEIIHEKSKKLTLIKGRGDILVSLVELTHEAY